ncbi:MAG TPA: hypothetical protein VN634_16070 [Candidatus Limnocylindrales bacterium]|nr:hypothetical protein [Candidatus Limnocylindrales bacterium]
MPALRQTAASGFAALSVDELTIDDEASFRHVALYAELKQVLRAATYRFRVLPSAPGGQWERALLLNLVFWQADAGGDVLADRHLPADVVAHAAWHHLASRAVSGNDAPASAGAMLLGEAIASAFDLYLIGRLLGQAPQSSFLQTQVPAMAEAAMAAGLPDTEFERLLASVACEPELAFSDLRELLSDVTSALFACDSAEAALGALARFETHRFASLLHHYELSNWILHARAHGHPSALADARVEAVDFAMRSAPVALDWLVAQWVLPAQQCAQPSAH